MLSIKPSRNYVLKPHVMLSKQEWACPTCVTIIRLPEHHLVSVWRCLSDSSAAQLPVVCSNGHTSTPESLSPGHVIYSGVLWCCPIINHSNKKNWDMRPEIHKMRWDLTLMYFTLPSDYVMPSHPTHIHSCTCAQYFFPPILSCRFSHKSYKYFSVFSNISQTFILPLHFQS